jgi:hypothetical protein
MVIIPHRQRPHAQIRDVVQVERLEETAARVLH